MRCVGVAGWFHSRLYVLRAVAVCFRECPNDQCRHLQKGNPRWPAMTCEKCGTEYCYSHSRAHVGLTCRQYLASRAQENKLNDDFIQRHSVKW